MSNVYYFEQYIKVPRTDVQDQLLIPKSLVNNIQVNYEPENDLLVDEELILIHEVPSCSSEILQVFITREYKMLIGKNNNDNKTTSILMENVITVKELSAFFKQEEIHSIIRTFYSAIDSIFKAKEYSFDGLDKVELIQLYKSRPTNKTTEFKSVYYRVISGFEAFMITSTGFEQVETIDSDFKAINKLDGLTKEELGAVYRAFEIYLLGKSLTMFV